MSAGNWVTITNIGGIAATSLYVNPQQYGFVLVGATSKPTGALAFDVFYNLGKDIVLTNLTATNTAFFAATNSLTATNAVVISPSSKAEFIAGRQVDLAPGFRAATGSTFRAGIDTGL